MSAPLDLRGVPADPRFAFDRYLCKCGDCGALCDLMIQPVMEPGTEFLGGSGCDGCDRKGPGLWTVVVAGEHQ